MKTEFCVCLWDKPEVYHVIKWAVQLPKGPFLVTTVIKNRENGIYTRSE